jgi:hypothetical protein
VGRGSRHDRACKHHCLCGEAHVHVCVMLHTDVLDIPLLSTRQGYAIPVVQDYSPHQPGVQYRHPDILRLHRHFHVHVSLIHAKSVGDFC